MVLPLNHQRCLFVLCISVIMMGALGFATCPVTSVAATAASPCKRYGTRLHVRIEDLDIEEDNNNEDDDDDDVDDLRRDQKIDEYQHASKNDPMWRKRSECWIIVVDDEEAIRRAAGQLLFDRGYQVTACADGATALRVATSKTRIADNGGSVVFKIPDCIVSDIRMPEIDGLELLRRIRDEETLIEVPVVLLTAKGMTQDRIAGYNAGADAYIPKPFDPDELVAIVDSVIARHETLNGANVQVDDLKRDLDEIKHLLLEKGGGGVGNGWVEQTNVFLAPDEREILELLCQGLMTKEIAAKTYLSTRRVEQLLTRMFRKTRAKNRTELVRWAVTTGNVQL